MKPLEWNCGHRGYKKFTLDFKPDGKNNIFHSELLDVETDEFPNLESILVDNLNQRKSKYVELLYSGGSDSEVTLLTCVRNNVPVKVLTMRYLVNGMVLNTHDLYYAEKMCRHLDLPQKILDVDIKEFFESGKYLEYLLPMRNGQAHVSLHYWLIDQCDDFPVMGGDYTWPWTFKPVLSPIKLPFAMYQKYMTDKGHHGIGDMLSHRIESNLLLIKNHIELMSSHTGGMDLFRNKLWSKVGFSELEPRMRNYGFNYVDWDIINLHKYTDKAVDILGMDSFCIKWNNKFAEVLGGEPGTNDKFK